MLEERLKILDAEEQSALSEMKARASNHGKAIKLLNMHLLDKPTKED